MICLVYYYESNKDSMENLFRKVSTLLGIWTLGGWYPCVLIAQERPTCLKLHYDRPAEYFEEALVIGNGTLGAIVYGGTEREVISLNDITLWSGETGTGSDYTGCSQVHPGDKRVAGQGRLPGS